MVSVFGSAPIGLQSFKETGPEDRDDFHIKEHVGSTAIFKVTGPEEVDTNDYGRKTAIRADVIVLTDGEGGGHLYEDALLFNAAVVSQLKSLAGQTTLATIELYQPKRKGSQPAPRLAEPPVAAVAAAEKYLKANG